MMLSDHFDNNWHFLMIKIFVYNFSICLHFAVICLLLWEFFLWKFFFGHHSNISLKLTLENTFSYWQQIIFTLTWNIWMMSDTFNIFNLFLAPFWCHDPKNSCPCVSQKNTRWFLISPNWWIPLETVVLLGKFAGFRV